MSSLIRRFVLSAVLAILFVLIPAAPAGADALCVQLVPLAPFEHLVVCIPLP